MIFTRDQLRTLRKTKHLTFSMDVQLDDDLEIRPCEYSAGSGREKASTIAVRTKIGTAPVMYVQVTDVQLESFEWRVSVKEHEAPFERRLLAADSTHGYTDNPALALADEPEAVDEQTQERITDIAEWQNRDLKRKRIKEMREGVDNAAAGMESTAMNRLDRKDLERIDFYMRRIEERAEDAA